ncbi:MAG: metallophosphoesterase [Candidatus Woesearchaeota archaeon]|jgi:hypothetical protein
MNIAIISDIHENFHNLTLFFDVVKEHNVEKIIFLGDFINNGIAKLLASSDIPVISIWGNNDGDKVSITKTALSEGSNLSVGFDTFDMIEVDNRKVFLTHYPMLAKPMAKSGEFDAVFYGHNHEAKIDKIGECLVVNPGELSAHKTGDATFAIWDTKKNSAELFTLKDALTLTSKDSKKHLDNKGIKFSKSKSYEY